MNLETRAREAATSLRTATPAHVNDGLRRLHRTNRRRTAGKVVAALAIVAVGLGAVQIERDRGRVQPISPLGQGVLVVGSDSKTDWSEPLAEQGIQTYPRFFSADPATRRFLVINEEGTEWTVMTPGRDEPLARISCGGCFAASLGPGPDEITTIDEDLTRIVVIDHDGRSRQALATLQVPDEGEGSLTSLAWSPDGKVLASVKRDGQDTEASTAVLLGRPGASEVTTLYRSSEPAPPWYAAQLLKGNDMGGWGAPFAKGLQWAPDSRRLAFVTLTTSERGRERGGDLDAAYQYRLFVADTATGGVEEIADLGPCNRRDWYAACWAVPPVLAWAPDGQSLSVLRNTTLTRFDPTGRVLGSEPANTDGPLLSGPFVWLEPD